MSKCLNCKKYEDCSTGSGCTWPCGAYVAMDIDVLTNADHIRAMTDEELAALFGAFCAVSECRVVDGYVCPFKQDCPIEKQGDYLWLEWLEQPWKEET